MHVGTRAGTVLGKACYESEEGKPKMARTIFVYLNIYALAQSAL